MNEDPRGTVVAKALKDPSFRALLLKDPADAIEKALGVKLPAGVSVKVVEDSAATVHLVLPAPDKSLSDAQLQKVAGGAGTYTQPDYCGESTMRSARCIQINR